MSSIARRARSQIAKLLNVAAAPATDPAGAISYALGGEAHILSSDGIINKMTGPFAVSPTGYLDGAQIEWASANEVTIQPGFVRDESDVVDLALTSSQVVDITDSGANGLDVGAEAADTWYAVYLIGDVAGILPVAGILSASLFAPSLPAGYNVYRRVGVVRNNAASDFYRFWQSGAGTERRYDYDETPATLLALSGGNAIAFTAVDLSGWVPPVSDRVSLQLSFVAPTIGGAAADELTLRPSGATSDGPFKFRAGITAAAGGATGFSCDMPTGDDQEVEYKVTDADDAASIWVTGFFDEI